MRKTQLRLLAIMIAVFVLLPGYGHSKPDSVNWATVESPAEYQAVPSGVVRVMIQLEEGADLESFKAKLNGKIATRHDEEEIVKGWLEQKQG